MQHILGSLTLIGLLALACDAQPAADDKAKMADKALASATPPVVAPATAPAGELAKPAEASAPADPAAPADRAAIVRKAGDGDRPAAVTTKAPDRVKAGDPAPSEPPQPDASAEGSLAQKEGWAEYTRDIQGKVAAVNTTCGSKLSASYDKSTYTDFDPLKDRTQGACKAAVGTLQAICATEEGKAAVQKLGKTVCKFSTTGTGVEKSGTTLVVKVDPVKSSISGKAAGSYSWASAIKEVL